MNNIEVKPPEKEITRWDLFKVFFASFFMQAVWNYRSLISIGFSVCLLPVIGKLCTNPQTKRDFFNRHLRFFNAHPYFASFALGVSIRLEQERAAGNPQIAETLERTKNLLISPLGAVGDRLFWATIKPASLILGMLGVLILPDVVLKITALLFTFLIYNIPHFYFRLRGILEGYNHPYDIYKYVGQRRFEKLRRFYLYLFILSLTFLVSMYGFTQFKLNPGLSIVFVLSTFYVYFFNKLLNNFYILALATFIFFLVAGILIF